MGIMDIKKTIRNYTKIYRKALIKAKISDIDTINSGFETRRNFFRGLLRCIDMMPNAYQIARKWNISDHDKRVKDGSLTYD